VFVLAAISPALLAVTAKHASPLKLRKGRLTLWLGRRMLLRSQQQRSTTQGMLAARNITRAVGRLVSLSGRA
jgi:hypothetical protein